MGISVTTFKQRADKEWCVANEMYWPLEDLFGRPRLFHLDIIYNRLMENIGTQTVNVKNAFQKSYSTNGSKSLSLKQSAKNRQSSNQHTQTEIQSSQVTRRHKRALCNRRAAKTQINTDLMNCANEVNSAHYKGTCTAIDISAVEQDCKLSTTKLTKTSKKIYTNENDEEFEKIIKKLFTIYSPTFPVLPKTKYLNRSENFATVPNRNCATKLTKSCNKSVIGHEGEGEGKCITIKYSERPRVALDYLTDSLNASFMEKKQTVENSYFCNLLNIELSGSTNKTKEALHLYRKDLKGLFLEKVLSEDQSSDIGNCLQVNAKGNKTISDIVFHGMPSFHQTQTVAPVRSLQSYFEALGKGQQPSHEDKMRYESLRLISFHKIRMAVSVILLASSGFYATGNEDETMCFSCKKRHRGWKTEEKPIQIHLKISPECPFITGKDTSNVPINSDRPQAPPTSNFCPVFLNNEPRESEELQTNEVVPSAATGVSANISPQHNYPLSITQVDSTSRCASTQSATDDLFSNAVHPHYKDPKIRIESFRFWPQGHCKKPAELVLVGFFYAGYSDCVRCFCCGIGLKNWEAGDDPWEEHVRFRFSCSYITVVKGEDFIARTIASLGRTSQQVLTTSESQRNATRPLSDSGILSRPVCKQVLDMGFAQEAIVRHVKDIEQTRGTNPIELELLLDRLLADSDNGNSWRSSSRSSNQADDREEITNSRRNSQPLTGGTGNGFKSEGEIRVESGNELEVQPEDEGYATAKPYENSSLASNEASRSGDEDHLKTAAFNTVPLEQRTTNEETNNFQSSTFTSLTEENRELRESSLCKICLDNTANIVFLPCGHLVACATCTPALHRCPMCRTFIRGSVRVHLASMSSVKKNRK